MRIGIDYRPALAAPGGIGVYVRELVDALARVEPDDHLALYGHRLRQPAEAAFATPPAGAQLHRRRVPAPVLDLAARAGFGADRVLGDVDVLHATDYTSFLSSRAPLVATIHDVCFHTLPACYDTALRRRLAEVTDGLVSRAARVIVPCERVARELVEYTQAKADCVRIVAHGAPTLAEAAPASELGRYVLFLGTVQPRKNLARLLEAFAPLRAKDPGLRLVVAGAPGWSSADLLAQVEAADGVSHVGPADRMRAAALLRGAQLVAYPSLGEGFGLPVLEAWHAEVPVLVGADTAAADLGGEGALAVDAEDPAAIEAGLARLLHDDALRTALVDAGRRLRADYTWDAAARATRAVYAEVVDA